MTHELKIWPEFFDDVLKRIKNFEIRNNDRGFKTGDTIILKEFDPYLLEYTGRECTRIIVYILFDDKCNALEDGFCVLGIESPCESETRV